MENQATMMAGCVIPDDEGRLLVLRRREETEDGENDPGSGRWELPGGKADLEDRGVPKVTAAREGKEELGVAVSVEQHLSRAAFNLDGRLFHYDFYTARIMPGQGPIAPESTYSVAEYKTPHELDELNRQGKLSAFVLYVLNNHLPGSGEPNENAA